MGDSGMGTSSDTSAGSAVVDAWLDPLAGDACGEDLEYDNEFLELVQAASGKPETQFAPAEPPDWRQVRSLAEGLFDRTRDLRVAVYWGRAMLRTEGASTLSESLRLVRGLLERHWDELHPRPDPDDGDAYARINALADMASADGLFGDLRQALIIRNRAIGELRGRDVEIALGTLAARDDETPMGASQIEQMLRDAVDEDAELARLPGLAQGEVSQLTDLMRERVGYERAPDLQVFTDFFRGLGGWMPVADSSSDDGGDIDIDALLAGAAGADDDRSSEPRARRRAGGGLGERIDTREDALRAIEMVCDYLERTEPTSPAQLLLRRASKLVNKNFLELVREFAPEAYGEVAKVMGVSQDDSSYGSDH